MPLQRTSRALAAAVLTSLLAAAPAARADVLLSVRLSDFGYALRDLDAGDGRAPGISFDATGGYALYGRVREGPVRPYQDGTQASSFLTTNRWPPAGTVSRRAEAPHSYVEAGVFGQLDDHSLGAFAAARAGRDRADPTAASQVEVSVTPVSVLLTLAPGTQVVWTGQVTASAQSTQGRRGPRLAEGAAAINLNLRTEDFSQTFDSFSAVAILAPGQAGRRRVDTGFELMLSNRGSTALTARLEGRLGGSATAFFPVPEPGAPLLGLCGAGVLAVALRRRRRLPSNR